MNTKAIGILLSCMIAVFASDSAVAQSLQSGNNNLQIIFTDSSSAVLRTDCASRQISIVSAGQKLVRPFSIAVGADGELYITDTGAGAILGVELKTGAQRVVSSRGILGFPCGIAVANDGNLLVANASAVIRVDSATGAQNVEASEGFLHVPLGVAVRPNGDLLVMDAVRKIIQIDARTRMQTLISENGFLNRPQAIAVQGNSIYLTDVAGSGIGNGRIIHVDARGGKQTILSEGNNLATPMGISIQASGQLIVGDPDTINPDTGTPDGSIVIVDPQTGAQELIARGRQDFINPRSVVIISDRGTSQ